MKHSSIHKMIKSLGYNPKEISKEDMMQIKDYILDIALNH